MPLADATPCHSHMSNTGEVGVRGSRGGTLSVIGTNIYTGKPVLRGHARAGTPRPTAFTVMLLLLHRSKPLFHAGAMDHVPIDPDETKTIN